MNKNTNIDPKDCLDVVLTDYQIHIQKKRNPNSLGRQYAKAVHGGKSRRAYSNDVKMNNNEISLSIPIGMEYFYDLGRKKGKKYIRFFIKKDGIPLLLGQDFVEKIKALEKKNLKR